MNIIKLQTIIDAAEALRAVTDTKQGIVPTELWKKCTAAGILLSYDIQLILAGRGGVEVTE